MSARPFDIVAAAEEAAQAGLPNRAEVLYKQGIEAYTREEPEGVDFALGRYGAFLLDQGRADDSARALERAIERGTDLPAIWSDYVRILADRCDLDGVKRTVERMAGSVRYHIEPEFLLSHARRAARQGEVAFAEAVARWVIERTTSEGDKAGRWAAVGDLGRLLERADCLDEAMNLWRAAFAEGSNDPETAKRLSMHLESAKDYRGAATVLREALTRGLPASAEEMLRKRLARCEAKITPGGNAKKASRQKVPAYSIRHESPLFEPLYQLRLKPAVRDLELVGSDARCLLVDKQSSTLVDIDVDTGAEVRRVENLPLLDDTVFAPNGCGIGLKRTAPIGKGPTLLTFFGADGRRTAESAVPDATSEIALGPDLWYVGCRDGYLYAFDLDGSRRWVWETPGLKEQGGDAYWRPCPYFVASRGSFAAVSSMGNIYAVSPEGRTVWKQTVPDEQQTRWTFTVPFSGTVDAHVADALRVLGVSPEASHDEIKSAYRRSALRTHPDRNPHDPGASVRFRKVQAAYERLIAPMASGTSLGGLTFAVELRGPGPMVSFLGANAEGVVVGSSQGRLYLLDRNGTLREARVLGDGPVRAALRPDGTLGAAWCDNALLFFRDGRIVNAAESAEWPRDLAMLYDDVVLWRRNWIHVLDGDGRLLWAAEFSRSISGVASQGDRLICAAGVLATFRRRR